MASQPTTTSSIAIAPLILNHMERSRGYSSLTVLFSLLRYFSMSVTPLYIRYLQVNTRGGMLCLTFRTLTRSKQRIFYLVFQNNFLTNTTSDGNPFFTIAGRSV
jgi:hypothetical protein